MPATRRTAAGADRPEPSAHVLRQFRIVFKTVRTHFQQVEKRAGVGGAHVWALSVVRRRPGIGVSDLAQALDIHQSTTSNLVRSLVARRLVKAEKRAADRRTVQLRLLPAGARVLRKAPGPYAGALPKALAKLDAATLRRLSRDLSKLIAALDARDPNAGREPLAGM
jgi:DNA-binding MarR family transcriptional regulator